MNGDAGETGSAPWCGHSPHPCGLAESHQPRTCRSFCRCRPRGAELPLRRPRVSCGPLWSLLCECSMPLRSLRLQRGLPSKNLSWHLQCSWPRHKEWVRSPTNTHLSINTEWGGQTALRGKSINTKKSSRVSWDVLVGPAARFAISHLTEEQQTLKWEGFCKGTRTYLDIKNRRKTF